MSDPEVLSMEKIANKNKAVLEIFESITSVPVDENLANIFTPEQARDVLDRLGTAANLLAAKDSHEQALQKLDAEIKKWERVEDEVLKELYKQIRPLEKSYRSIELFFANAEVPEAKTQAPLDLHLVNADLTSIRNPVGSPTIDAIKEYVRSRNDHFNFRLAINNLVAAGFIPDAVRKELEELADKYGMLLIGDLRDEKSFKDLKKGFGGDGIYASLKRPQDQAATDVILASYSKLRDPYWFEQSDGSAEDGLFIPSSAIFAGAIARADRSTGAGIAQGPVGMKHGKIKGVEKGRFEPLVSETEDLTMNCQVVTIIRNADNDLCFIGNRTQADDPGLMKFFTTYRVFRFVERMIENYVRQVVGKRLDRETVDKDVIEPIIAFLKQLQETRAIQKYDLNHDYNEKEYAKGIVSLDITLTPVGPAEQFNIRIGAADLEKTAE